MKVGKGLQQNVSKCMKCLKKGICPKAKEGNTILSDNQRNKHMFQESYKGNGN